MGFIYLFSFVPCWRRHSDSSLSPLLPALFLLAPVRQLRRPGDAFSRKRCAFSDLMPLHLLKHLPVAW
jgi:hypothetical protein